MDERAMARRPRTLDEAFCVARRDGDDRDAASVVVRPGKARVR